MALALPPPLVWLLDFSSVCLCLLFAAYILYYFCVCLYDAIRPLGCDVMLLKSYIISYHIISYHILAQKRDIWRRITVDGAVTSESDRVKEAKNKRQLRKCGVNDHSTRSVPMDLVCPTCHRLFHGRIGLKCTPIYLRYYVIMVIIILMDKQRRVCNKSCLSNKCPITPHFLKLNSW